MTLSVSLQHGFEGFDLDIAFEAPSGITVLFGRSGAGKSTIVNAVAGLLRPRAGRIVCDDTVLFDSAQGQCIAPHRRRVGYIFQDARLFPHLTVRQNLLYGRWFAPAGAPRADLDRILALLGIEHLLRRRPGHLSGGERQRVAIGRALLASPRIILADEPLAALDEQRKAEILPYFERLRDEISVPILYVSHAASEVARIATTVVALDAGRVARQGPAADVLSDPAVTPLGVRAAGAMLEARVAAHHPDGLSALDAAGVTLLLPRVDQAPGTSVRVWIEAQDVMLATTRPDGISALNVLEVTVKELRFGAGPGVLVQLALGEAALLARITRRSAEALSLAPGARVFAVLKAVSVARDAIGDQPTSGGAA
ncbi:molybdenum ABC transporter ATP-binding protein [Roseobacter sinensis]|uniref:Molybdenum ABC transporter ATP-binding protein n=1 Tax=Roseobacter sinensis TaxID=2931391 RepID=A0ABT3BII9_9RHOB|nr:molybdenum ABC transporter ATP-binding protein [Roseobacter sp. WL0113]MCV3273038.1 molybdenum ABC transporter ATP-binding protein [Roseobacter sp. WL0113]